MSNVTLSSVCIDIFDCEHKTAPTSKTGHPSIRTPNIGRGFIIFSDLNLVDDDTYKAWTRRAIPQKDDIIFAREAPVGNAIIIPPNFYPCLGQRTVLIRPNKTIVNPRYLLYNLLGSEMQAQIHSLANGATVHHLNVKDIKNLKIINLHGRAEQDKIAEMIAVYDNLIDNNNRRIAILEEMAQCLYREWFVHFRFPGHENVKMIESELGMIPEGWEIKNLFECADVQYGYAFKSKAFTENRSLHPVVRIRDILGNETNTFTPEDPDGRYLLQNGDILIGMDGIFHMNQWAGGKAYLNQRVVRMRSANTPMLQLFYSLQPVIKQLETTISGTTVAHLSDSDLKKISVLLPDVQIQERATRLFDVILSEKISLIQRNRNLSKTRDHLFPRLISGDIDVSKIEM